MNHVPCTQWRYVAMHSVFCVEKKIAFTPVNCLIHTCYYWKFICCLCSLLKTFAPCGSNEKKMCLRFLVASLACKDVPCLQGCYLLFSLYHYSLSLSHSLMLLLTVEISVLLVVLSFTSAPLNVPQSKLSMSVHCPLPNTNKKCF